MGDRQTISLSMFVQNEEDGLEAAILSVRDHVDAVVIWDTGSTDGTVEIAKKYASRLYTLRVPEETMNFGHVETMVCHLAKTDWVLRLDGDETLENAELLQDHIDSYHGAWAFPRYRWADLEKTVQLEKEAFPDLQYRFFRADGRSHYDGAMHSRFITPYPIGTTDDILINHFVDPLHLSDPKRAARRLRLYTRLAAEQGIQAEGSAEAVRLARVHMGGEGQTGVAPRGRMTE